jgi:hypothetical protein
VTELPEELFDVDGNPCRFDVFGSACGHRGILASYSGRQAADLERCGHAGGFRPLRTT